MRAADVAVIGAGFGGLATAAVLAAKGLHVVVCEGSSELGGCAGKFEREGYRFSVGATYGMGFERGGLFDRLYRELKLPNPPLRSQSVIMDVHLPDRITRYYRFKDDWFKEIKRVFPEQSQAIVDFYTEVLGCSSMLEGMAEHRPLLPPKRIDDVRRFMRMLSPRLVSAAPLLLQTVEQRLRRFGLAGNKPFVHFLNGQLIDSVQTTADRCPALLGYTALNVFHRGAYYVEGGLARIAEDLAGAVRERGGEVKLRTRIRSLKRIGSGWLLESARGDQVLARHVVVNNSHRHLNNLLEAGGKGEDSAAKQAPIEMARAAASSSSTYVQKQYAQEDVGDEMGHSNGALRVESEAWGAFALYMGCKLTAADSNPIREAEVLYHQVISSYDEPMTEGNQLLLSFSHELDAGRAPAGRTAVTASTHTEAKMWWDRSRYEALKNAYTERMLASCERALPGFRSTVELLLPATPVTFKRYTQRELGYVGGPAPSRASDVLRMASPYTDTEGLWVCGDHVYPGAGTLGTAMSGWMVAERLSAQLEKQTSR
ncbi:NAD(P)/FAD-dependent oxidoreductase [Paenibacillus sp. YYML68]|uniref:phytoene desaturase family protein n=1 Tax=Paenibacillus sp. YYML68 TaxID=2909250 RepID=UPI0024939863|nr:FAD-dependent oxidoreductase [Paenibacillus sp. YYML68]